MCTKTEPVRKIYLSDCIVLFVLYHVTLSVFDLTRKIIVFFYLRCKRAVFNKKRLLINLDLLSLILSNLSIQYKIFIGLIRQNPVLYGYFPYWPDYGPSNNS
jgi:hypothetical protein